MDQDLQNDKERLLASVTSIKSLSLLNMIVNQHDMDLNVLIPYASNASAIYIYIL